MHVIFIVKKKLSFCNKGVHYLSRLLYSSIIGYLIVVFKFTLIIKNVSNKS